jgi:hypothetical protein
MELQKKFHDMFDHSDVEEKRMYEQLPKCDAAPLVAYLKAWVAVIRKHPFSARDFALFKLDILQYELPDFVVWSAKPQNAKCMYVMFDLNWANINNAQDAYLAYMMIENTRIMLPQLKTEKQFWSLAEEQIALYERAEN